MALIYPSRFDPCIVTCALDGSRRQVCIYNETTADTVFAQLPLADDIFSEGGSRFRADLVPARDGGRDFLTLVDVMVLMGQDTSGKGWEWKQAKINEILEQVVTDASTHDFRLLAPRVFPASDIHEVVSYHIPNHPGHCLGAALVDDNFNAAITFEDQDRFVVRRTRYPDVYELFLDGVRPVPGNNTAYVPTLELSKEMRKMFEKRNSCVMRCTFDDRRQKWIPCPE
jgi:hypothetical protein